MKPAAAVVAISSRRFIDIPLQMLLARTLCLSRHKVKWATWSSTHIPPNRPLPSRLSLSSGT